MTTRTILCLNGGSSSLKFALYDASAPSLVSIGRGAVEGIGADRSRSWVRSEDGSIARDETVSSASLADAFGLVLGALQSLGASPPVAIGHRLVHGGPTYFAPVRISREVRAGLDAILPFAPLHLPSELAVVDAAIARFPEAAQIACFDTAFHRAMPEIARRLPIKRALFDEDVCRYGFHGLSYQYVMHALGAEARGRVVIAHLGSGASMVAVRNGSPIDTTMGLTPTGGLMMGTRSGDLDPGVLLYLMRSRGYSSADIERLVNHESGLLGVSGSTGNMQTLLTARDADPRAAIAIDMFAYEIRKSIGAFAAALDGLDTLVFTGGIGEHSAPVRAAICDGLAHLGVLVDAAKNDGNERTISAEGADCAIHVVPTDEERMIAIETRPFT